MRIPPIQDIVITDLLIEFTQRRRVGIIPSSGVPLGLIKLRVHFCLCLCVGS